MEDHAHTESEWDPRTSCPTRACAAVSAASSRRPTPVTRSRALIAVHGRELELRSEKLLTAVHDLERREERARELHSRVEQILREGSAELDSRQAELNARAAELDRREAELAVAEDRVAEARARARRRRAPQRRGRAPGGGRAAPARSSSSARPVELASLAARLDALAIGRATAARTPAAGDRARRPHGRGRATGCSSATARPRAGRRGGARGRARTAASA